MPSHSTFRSLTSFWTRLAIALSFLAVFSALAAPASMLAEDVRTGKLGGVCAVNVAAFAGSDAGTAADSGADHAASHCELCGSLGLGLPALLAVTLPSTPATGVVAHPPPASLQTAIAGLPFSRGPPSFS